MADFKSFLLRLDTELMSGVARFWLTPGFIADNVAPAVSMLGEDFVLPSYGPELVVNGTYDTNIANWAGQGTSPVLSWQSGVIRVENGAAAEARANQSFVTVAGKLYELRLTRVGGAAGAYSVGADAGATNIIATTAAALGTPITVYFIAVSNSTQVNLRTNSAGAGVFGEFKNVSCREVMLGELGANLGANTYTLSPNVGASTAAESPAGTITLVCDGTNAMTADKSFTTVVGKHYRIISLMTTTVSAITVGTSQGGSQVVTSVVPAAVGVSIIEFIATATTTWVRFRRTSAGTSVVSNITIAEWMPSPTVRLVPKDTVYGPNLIPNSTIDGATTGWTGFNATLSAVSGALRVTNTGAAEGWASLNIATVRGRTYEITLDAKTGSNTQAAFGVWDAVQSRDIIARTGTGNYPVAITRTFVATSTLTEIDLYNNVTTAAQFAEFDNIVVREVIEFGAVHSTGGQAIRLTCNSISGVRSRIARDGLLKFDTGANEARVDWSDGTARFLFEDQSTNLLLRSSEFDNASWVKSGATVVANQIAAPDGTLTADKIVENSANTVHQVQQAVATVVSTTYTYSAKVKAGERTWGHIYMTGVPGSGVSVNLLTGALGTVQGSVIAGSAKVEPLPDGWFRVSAAAVATATNNGVGVLPALADNTTSYLGDGTSGIYVYGAQLEALPFVTSYIPTGATAATRQIETPLLSPLVTAIGSLPGATMSVKGKLSAPIAGARILGMATTANLMRAAVGTPTSFTCGGTGTTLPAFTNVLPGPFGGVTAFNSSGRSGSANGQAVVSDAVAVESRSVMYLARSGTVSGDYGNGFYRSFSIWPMRVSNAALPGLAAA